MKGHLNPSLYFFALLSCLFLSVLADMPKVDFGRMGVVALGGAFAGLDFYTANPTNTFDSSSSTLLTRASNGTISPIGSTNAGGSINAVCGLGNTVYIGGNFSSLSGASYSHITAYDITSRKLSPLQSGLDGVVHALFCDSSSNELWAGGDFHIPVGADATQYGGSVAVFNIKTSSWNPPGFFGLSGENSSVRVISRGSGSASSALYFAGSFLTAYATNTTVNSTNNPNVPYSSGATPFSSSLVPIPLSASDVNANPSSTESGFTDIANILCPSGPDGPGNTWFSQSGVLSHLTILTHKFQNSRGIRLGNTFISNHGTKTFTVTTIPNNDVLQLTYIDPTSKANMTCTTACPLLSDPSVPYQDFLFSDSATLTGVQITLLEWNGASSGLHLLQLLSDGAFASAISDNNARSCFSPNASGVYQTGYWAVINAVTNIPGTIQTMLEATVKVGTPSSSAPALTWLPYVSASGVYNVYVYVPGCQQFGDCAKRTSVDIIVYPGGSMSPVTKTVDQRVESDSRVLIYTGYVVPTVPAYSVTIKLALAANPTGSGSGGRYEIIADRVQLELISLEPNGTGGEGSGGTPTGRSVGFGFFEWNSGTSGNINATSVIPNTSETHFNTLSTKFASALGSSLPSSIVNAIVAVSDNNLFLGGSFAGTNVSSNIVSYAHDALVPLPANGLNGTVTALAFANNTLYVGGSFGGPESGSSVVLRNIAMYNLSSNSWEPLGGGLNGAVSALTIVGGQLLVSGNFTETYADVGGFGAQSGGVATWDVSQRKWVSGGSLVLGSASLVATSGSGSATVEYIAGNIRAVSGNSAPGWAFVNNDKNGAPGLGGAATPLMDLAVEAAGTHIRRKRMPLEARSVGSWFIPSLFGSSLISSRSSGPPAALPSSPAAPAPAVLSMAFWTNQSNSDEAVVLGGNFSFVATAASTTSSGIALYYTGSKTIAAIQGPQVNGTVYSVFVKDHSLYVGGDFTVGASAGLAVYDLYSSAWQTNVGTLSGDSTYSSDPIVRSISNPPSESKYVVVAGTLSGAAGVTCEAVCAFDTSVGKWVGLGGGIKGEVAAVDYARVGPSDVLVVAGSIQLPDGTAANVAKYYFSNSSWAAVGSGLPGPATAVSVNDDDINNIFAAGRTSDGSSPFVLHWDGKSWNTINNPLSGSTAFSQLAFVPLMNDHSDNSLINKDRVLLVSGSLTSDSFGNVSAALFDGNAWYPYMTSTTPSGASGLIAGLFHSFTTFSFNRRHFLATGIVILISMAIAIGIVFFLLLAGVIWTLLSRDNSQLDQKAFIEDDDDSTRRPSSLLEHINAATRSTIIGTGAGAGVGTAAGRQSTEDHAGPSTEGGHTTDGDGWRRAETPAFASGGGVVGSGNEPEEEIGRPAFARYSFEGEGEGELALQTGAQLSVLDDRDAAWWYVRDEQGREGIVPAAYLY